MPSQIERGEDFATGDTVTAETLQNLVSNATLLPGAINEQIAATELANTDSVLIASSSALKKVTGAVLRTGLVKTDGTVPMTGELTLSTSLPTSGLKAASKGYVDTQLGNYLLKAGGTITGALTVNSGITAYGGLTNIGSLNVTTEASVPDPTIASNAANKNYVDNEIKTKAVKAKISFTGVTPDYTGSSTTQRTSKFINVNISRTANSNDATIDFSALPSPYKQAATPFFHVGQYIGIIGQSGISSGLYEIKTKAANTFTITTTQTTSLASVAIQLSCIFDYLNPSANELVWSSNIKSIYWDPTCNKHYYNFIEEIFTGGQINAVYQARDVVVSGQAVKGQFLYKAAIMIDANRSDYIQSAAIPEGYGSTNMGCHVGYFQSYDTGLPSNYFTSANVSFM